MPKNIFIHPYDLISPDGFIRSFKPINERLVEAVVVIENISSRFKGFEIDPALVSFTIKSTFAQLGVDGIGYEYELIPKFNRAEVKVQFKAFTQIGCELLKNFSEGIYVGKLFAADDRRRVRTIDYLTRLLNKTDSEGYPLLIFGEKYKSERFIEDAAHDRIVVEVPLLPGLWVYDDAIHGFIQTIVRGLKRGDTSFRKFLFLHQTHKHEERKIPENGMLLVRTTSINIRTLFAKVVPEMLPEGFNHATADLIEPQRITGDIFEFHGLSEKTISHIPLEFYTLEPFREHFFFADKDLLKDALEKPTTLFSAFETAPNRPAASFIVKEGQLSNLQTSDWIISDPPEDNNLMVPPEDRKQKMKLKEYLSAQSVYVIAHAMQEGNITSQGVILSNFLPNPLLKNLLLNDRVTRCLHAVYFRSPSQKHGEYFSHDDRSMLYDLARASVQVFWVDFNYNLVLKYVLREGVDYGLFVPLNKEKEFLKATFFGVYGSRLKDPEATEELYKVFKGLIEMKQSLDHDKLNPDTPLAITTGGGPGVMAMGNKIASDLGILSVGHAVDFTKPHEDEVIEEAMNPYIQAKMTYRLEHLFVRQSEFNLDFPIFFEGGIGTDFEFVLEQLRTQVAIKTPAPILLFGPPAYWKEKITHSFQINRESGTIRGSEWVSNTFYCVQNSEQALQTYYRFFTNRLAIGRDAPANNNGFVIVKDSLY